MALAGDTVRLTATFKDFAGTNVDPTAVELNIYKDAWVDPPVRVAGPFTPTKTAVGVYQYDYTLPSFGYDAVAYEFKGTVGGTAETIRGRITITWV